MDHERMSISPQRHTHRSPTTCWEVGKAVKDGFVLTLMKRPAWPLRETSMSFSSSPHGNPCQTRNESVVPTPDLLQLNLFSWVILEFFLILSLSFSMLPQPCDMIPKIKLLRTQVRCSFQPFLHKFVNRGFRFHLYDFRILSVQKSTVDDCTARCLRCNPKRFSIILHCTLWKPLAGNKNLETPKSKRCHGLQNRELRHQDSLNFHDSAKSRHGFEDIAPAILLCLKILRFSTREESAWTTTRTSDVWSQTSSSCAFTPCSWLFFNVCSSTTGQLKIVSVEMNGSWSRISFASRNLSSLCLLVNSPWDASFLITNNLLLQMMTVWTTHFSNFFFLKMV